MKERLKDIILGIFIFLILVAAFAFIVDTLLLEKFSINENLVGSTLGGILSFFGGAIGALGAYYASKKQIDSQIESLEKEKNDKARPYIICKKIETDLNSNSHIFNTDYYNKSIPLGSDLAHGENVFFMIKIIGSVDYVFDCRIKLTLDKDYCNKRVHNLYLDYLEKEHEIFIPIPSSSKEALSLVKLELYYETSTCEKIKYVYDYIIKHEKSFLSEGDKEVLLWERHFEPVK